MRRWPRRGSQHSGGVAGVPLPSLISQKCNGISLQPTEPARSPFRPVLELRASKILRSSLRSSVLEEIKEDVDQGSDIAQEGPGKRAQYPLRAEKHKNPENINLSSMETPEHFASGVPSLKTHSRQLSSSVKKPVLF